jgi:transposase-like protein
MLNNDSKSFLCKFCGSASVVRYGFSQKRRQRHLCLTCNRTFLDNAAPERMRYPTSVISSSVNQFYEGKSLNQIRRQLEMDFNVLPDPSSIYDWVFHFTQKAIQIVESIQPRTGQTWLASETALKLKSPEFKVLRVFDCIDQKSHFLLASHLLQNNDGEDAIIFLNGISERIGGQKPRTLILDKPELSIHTLKPGLLADFKHLPEYIQYSGKSCTGIKQLHRTLGRRTRIMRGLTSPESADLVMHGWGIHYNFFCPHPELRGKTPAGAAGVNLALKSWADIINGPHHPKLQLDFPVKPEMEIPPEMETCLDLSLVKR